MPVIPESRFFRQNTSMSDVSIYVAVISACAGIAGAAVPQIASVVKDGRQAERDRKERRTDALRQDCAAILGAAGELRTLVANAARYQGDEMEDLLAKIRSSAEAVQLQTDKALLAPETLGGHAQQLAEAAARLAEEAVAHTDIRVKAMPSPPTFTEFDQCTKAFRKQAKVEIAGES
jgi:hypothetical protein